MTTLNKTKPWGILCILFLFMTVSLINAQAQPFRVGRVSAEDFIQGEYEKDPDASAVILYDYGNTYMDLDTRSGSFYYVYEKQIRVQILNEDGYDWADFSIPLLDIRGTRENMSRFRGHVHNLDGSRVRSTRIRSRDGMTERTSENLRTIKFSFPDIQPGSIVEYRYTIRSPFLYNLPSWQFQHTVPVEYSEYNLELPEFYNYQFYMQGYETLDIAEQDVASMTYLLPMGNRPRDGTGRVTASTTTYKWVMSDVPAMRSEPYTSNIRNFLSMIRFELSSINFPGQTPIPYTLSWLDIDERLREDDRFGGFLSGSRQLRREMEDLDETATTETEKIVAALNYIHDNIRWNERRGIYASGSPRNILREGTGNAADINLMLVAALRQLGINADPVVSSTRDNGIVIPSFPTMSRFNYVLAALTLDDGEVMLLDATDTFCPPGMIPARALNGEGRRIKDNNAEWVKLETDFPSLEKRNYHFSIDQQGNLKGNSRAENSDYAAYSIRRDLERELNQDDYIKSLQEEVPGLEITSLTIENAEDLDQPIIKEMDMELAEAISHAGDMILFTPLLFEALEENPFRIDERNYPVDFTVPFKEQISMIFEIPEGFEVDFLPESLNITYDDQANFDFAVRLNEKNQIEVHSTFEVLKTMFLPSDYDGLKSFFGKMVEKQTEQIVLTAI